MTISTTEATTGDTNLFLYSMRTLSLYAHVSTLFLNILSIKLNFVFARIYSTKLLINVSEVFYYVTVVSIDE